MTRELIERRRDEVVARFGPWTAFNVHLGEGVYTIAPGVAGMAEQRVGRIVRLVRDFAPRGLSGLRVLDLGAYEGGFAIALARQGAEVVAIEGREPHVEKGRFAAEALGLDNLKFLHEDVRRLGQLELGSFDVVLCLGVLYHLPGPDVIRLVRNLAARCSGFAIVETQIGLRAKTRIREAEREYRGFIHAEDITQPGASLDNRESFWPTRASLINLLADEGFTSVVECLAPAIPALDAYRDHVTLIAKPGEPESDPGSQRWPERLPVVAHPSQGLRYRVLERLRRKAGGGLLAVFKRG
jgi:2-polyprenyl-3-methyl-5-hydroxy-6-metoxy-1,4-benzoquinol methylase